MDFGEEKPFRVVLKLKIRTQIAVLKLRTCGHNSLHYHLSYGALWKGIKNKREREKKGKKGRDDSTEKIAK